MIHCASRSSVVTLSPVRVSQNLLHHEAFYHSLFALAGGERIRTYLQCATCSGVCPFGYLMDFPPGRMIAWLRAGLFEEVLQTDTVWMCVSCYACTEVCPAQIPLTLGLMTRSKEELLLEEERPRRTPGCPDELPAVWESLRRIAAQACGLGERHRARSPHLLCWWEAIAPMRLP